MLLFVVCTIMVAMATGNSSGAPTRACGDMVPQHGTTPEPPSSNPYNITHIDNGDGTYDGRFHICLNFNNTK